MSQDIKYLTKKGRSRSRPTWQTYVFLVLIFGIHIGLLFLGGYVFMLLEKGQNKTSESYVTDFLAEHDSVTLADVHRLLKIHDEFERQKSSNESSNFDNEQNDGSGEGMIQQRDLPEDEFTLKRGFILSFAIATTVGYGDVTPVTLGGKLFCILFALLSIPLTFLLVCKIAVLLAYYNELMCEAILKKKQYACSVRSLGLFFMTVFGFVLYVLIPSLVLTYAFYEDVWSFVDSLYFVFVTLTTIGFGDMVIDAESAGLWACVVLLIWVIAGMSWFAALITMVKTMFQNRVRSSITDVN